MDLILPIHQVHSLQVDIIQCHKFCQLLCNASLHIRCRCSLAAGYLQRLGRLELSVAQNTDPFSRQCQEFKLSVRLAGTGALTGNTQHRMHAAPNFWIREQIACSIE